MIDFDTAKVIANHIEFITTKEDTLEDAHIALSGHINLPFIGNIVSVACTIIALGGGNMSCIQLGPLSSIVFDRMNVLEEVMEQIDFIVSSAAMMEVVSRDDVERLLHHVITNWGVDNILGDDDSRTTLGSEFIKLVVANIHTF